MKVQQDGEIWRDVKGFEGEYQISNQGRVRSLDRTRLYHSSVGNPYYRMFKGQILKQSYSLKYLQVSLTRNRKSVSKLVHRLVAEAFIPNPDNLPEVNHKDENPSNNVVDNLEWCTKSYNINYGSRNEMVRKALKGRPKSKECIQKVSESLKGHVPWNKGLHTRPIICLDANIEFDCSNDAAAWIGGVTPEAVDYAVDKIACCKGHVFVHADKIPEDIQSHISKCLDHYRKGSKAGRPCKCIEDNLVFKYITDAAKHYNLTYNLVQSKLLNSKGAELADGRIIHFERISYEEAESYFNAREDASC